jgi:hypothetical protein
MARVVVDGSNIATEGRSLPSLAQLNEAVDAYKREHPTDDVIVVVDATFGYRIDEAERKAYEQAELAGSIVSPPAGAIGRGDGFLLQIADRVGATVLSNDSFQEFHGEYDWLFADGRLVGGKPVPGVGWIFTPRAPVRGPRSRMALQAARREKKKERPVVDAIAEATADAIAPARTRRRRRRGKAPASPLNEPLPFITFIANHALGTEVSGTVDSFTSHGAFVIADGARCYVPISGLGEPPPRSAKEVLTRGEVRTFVVQALDPPRRGIELAFPGLAHVAGEPTEETVDAEIRAATAKKASAKKHKVAKKDKVAKKAAGVTVATERASKRVPAETEARKPAAGKAASTGTGAARTKRAATKKGRTTPPAKAATKKAEAKKAEAKKAPVKAAAAKKTTAKKSPATATVKKATGTKATATKRATTAKRAPVGARARPE